MQPAVIVHEHNRSPGHVFRGEMQGIFLHIQAAQTLLELFETGGGFVAQRGDYVFAEAHHTGPPRLAGRHDATDYIALGVNFNELGRDGDAKVRFEEGGGGRRGE